MIQTSTTSSLENDKLAQLIERLDRMQTKMDAVRSRDAVLEAENAQLTKRLDRMQNKMDGLQSRMEVLEVENNKWATKFADLAKTEKLKNQISYPMFSFSSPNEEAGEPPRLLTSPPTSCEELKNNNGLWPMDGIHLLKKQNKIKAAFCTFAADGSSVSEALIGQVAVLSNPIHFYVQRKSNFNSYGVIPFELQRLNKGNAFSLSSGIFTAPLNGIYYFQFSGYKDRSAVNLHVHLRLNGASIAISGADQVNTSGNYLTASLSASLQLEKGDRVNVWLDSGMLHDNDLHYTHFTGWLMEEDLI